MGGFSGLGGVVGAVVGVCWSSFPVLVFSHSGAFLFFTSCLPEKEGAAWASFRVFFLLFFVFESLVVKKWGHRDEGLLLGKSVLQKDGK